MLYIRFGRTKNTVVSVDSYFDLNYEENWFNDVLVQKMITDVDKSTVLSPNCIQSDALGQIPPTKLSGGVKALILLLKESNIEIWASACGDNCAKWIIEIGKRKNINIVLEHGMDFKTDFDAICVNDGSEIRTMHEYISCIGKYL